MPDPERQEAQVPDVINVAVPQGIRVLVVSDLHLRPTVSSASGWSAPVIASKLADWKGDGLLILAGDLLEMWFVLPPDPKGCLEAHAELATQIRNFADIPGRRVLYAIGNHDGRLGWDTDTQHVVRDMLHAELTFAVELTIEGGSKGDQKVRIEHGHAYDPANAFHDPRDPGETPLGQHVVEEILPTVTFTDEGWLAGIDSLADPRTFPAFLMSRLFYRRVLHDAKWLLLPVLLFLAVRLPLMYFLFLGHGREVLPKVTRTLLILDIAFLLFVGLMAVVLLISVRRAWKSASNIVATQRGAAQNDNTRDAASKLIGEGYAGMVCGHTHHPEMSAVGSGFYANTGSCTQVVDRVEARFGMPHVFLPRVQLTWVEMEPADEWSIRLVEGRRAVPGSTIAERRMEKYKGANVEPDPAVVGAFPGGPFPR